MSRQDRFYELKRLGALLTQPGIPPGTAWEAGEQLFQLFLLASGLDTASKKAREDMLLPSGKALAPVWAAFCIRDFQRTRSFLRGILQAIRSADNSGEPLHVLYAGTGPFASLVLPLIPLLEKNRAVFTLLDVHPYNIELLHKTRQAFGISGQVLRIEQADAVTYRARETPHLLVAEMMQAGLQNEPQVAAMLNLVPQLPPGGILIPQRITVSAGLLHPGRNRDRMMGASTDGAVYRLLQEVMDLSQSTVPSLAKSAGHGFPEIVVNIPAARDPGFRELALFTRIEVFADERLGVWDCALTQPVFLTDLDAGPENSSFGLRYQLGARPGFQFRLLA